MDLLKLKAGYFLLGVGVSILAIGLFTCADTACTIKVDAPVPPPNITVNCVEVVLGPGMTTETCVDGGDAAPND